MKCFATDLLQIWDQMVKFDSRRNYLGRKKKTPQFSEDNMHQIITGEEKCFWNTCNEYIFYWELQHTHKHMQKTWACNILNCVWIYMTEPAGPHRNTPGCWKSYSPWERRAGEPGGGSDLPASMESPERVCPAKRPGPARLPTTGVCTPACLPAFLSVRLSVCLNLTSDLWHLFSVLTGVFLWVGVSWELFGQRRDFSVLPVTGHPQQYGTKPGGDVKQSLGIPPSLSARTIAAWSVTPPPACDQLITSSKLQRGNWPPPPHTHTQEKERKPPLTQVFCLWSSDWQKLRKQLLHDWYGQRLLYRSPSNGYTEAKLSWGKKKIQTGRHFLAGTEFWTFNCEHIVSCFLRFFFFYLIHLLDCGALLTLCLKVRACESTRVVKYFILRAGYRLFELLGQKLNYCYIIYCYKTIRKGIINW